MVLSRVVEVEKVLEVIDVVEIIEIVENVEVVEIVQVIEVVEIVPHLGNRFDPHVNAVWPRVRNVRELSLGTKLNQGI